MNAVGLVRNRITGKLERVEEPRTEADIAAAALADTQLHNDEIRAQLQAADLSHLRALFEGDTERLDRHRASQATLRAKLKPE